MAEITYREAVKRALREEMQHDPNVVVWGEDIVNYNGSGGAYEGRKEGTSRSSDGAGSGHYERPQARAGGY